MEEAVNLILETSGEEDIRYLANAVHRIAKGLFIGVKILFGNKSIIVPATSFGQKFFTDRLIVRLVACGWKLDAEAKKELAPVFKEYKGLFEEYKKIN